LVDSLIADNIAGEPDRAGYQIYTLPGLNHFALIYSCLWLAIDQLPNFGSGMLGGLNN